MSPGKEKVELLKKLYLGININIVFKMTSTAWSNGLIAKGLVFDGLIRYR